MFHTVLRYTCYEHGEMTKKAFKTRFQQFCVGLRNHNLQRWKGSFFTCPCHMIYRVKAFGLLISNNYTFKRRFLRVCEIWGYFAKKKRKKPAKLVINCLIMIFIEKIEKNHIFDSYNYYYMLRVTFRFYFIDLQINT